MQLLSNMGFKRQYSNGWWRYANEPEEVLCRHFFMVFGKEIPKNNIHPESFSIDFSCQLALCLKTKTFVLHSFILNLWMMLIRPDGEAQIITKILLNSLF